MNPSLVSQTPQTPVDNNATVSVDPSSLVNNTPSQAPQESWWKKLLPAAGGIAATLLAPETGGASLLADAALFGLGSAAGKAAENVTSGKSIGSDVLPTGLESAAGGALFGGAAKAGQGLLSGLFGSNAAQGAADRLIPGLIVKQSDNMLSHTDASALANHGLDFTSGAKVAPELTGSTGGSGAKLTNSLENILDNRGLSTNVMGIPDIQGSIMTKYPGLKDSAVKDISNTVNNSFNQMASDSGFQVSRMIPRGKGQDILALEPGSMQSMKSGAVYRQAKALQDLSYSIESKAPKDVFGNVTDPSSQAAIDVYRNIGNALEEKALGTGVDNLGLTEKESQDIINSLSGLQKKYPQLYNNLTQSFQPGTPLKALRTEQSPFVGVNKAVQGMAYKANTAPGKGAAELAKIASPVAGGMIAGPAGVAAGLIPAVLSSKTADTALAKGLLKIGSKGIVPASDLKAAEATLPRATRIATATGGVLGTIPSVASTNQNVNMNQGLPMQNTPMQQNPLSQLYETLLAQEQMAPAYFASSLPSVLQQLAPAIQKQQLVAPSLEAAMGAYGAAGGSQGLGGGLLSNILGLVPGTAQNTYQRQLNAASAGLGSLLGISPGQAGGMFPTFTQTPQAATPQLSGLGSVLSTLPLPQ